MTLEPLTLFIHLSSVSIWVGGMFFAYVCLRPAALEVLEPPQRLRLWGAVFGRFFTWVWGAVAMILGSGLARLVEMGFAHAPIHWHLMLLLGLIMMAIFAHVYFAPYGALKRAVAVEDWKAGGAALNRIRQLVGLNLVLAGVTIAVATLGRWLI
ncbi:DUF4149 domain-containing protein [Denitratisoma oestradiolicum]|uniref:Copper resistance protein D domain-containing protein n=1 Tax=Denitratisoma oestradiolicum TaxID=311182 RepID=A0A6S6XZD6_9PROT|nr:DUF4149 domain-containing protein [Denitratisoma oestradiolicum]TWO79257.1 hypothetical protein CBW56_15825 [Denitratisoma oestradiolicum]CAB1368262.1 conserved membrane protein of unknown function [Denitratisoma oestradiolicum]